MTTETGIHPRILKARRAVVMRAPFWGCLLMYLRPVELSEAECPTMATDGMNLFYSVAFVDSLSDEQLIGVLVHEVSHPANLHHTRRNGRDPELWNIAADYAINGPILKAGFTLPDGGCVDSCFDGLNAEQIYRILQSEKQQPQPAPEPETGDDSGQDQPGQDTGATGDESGAGNGEPGDNAADTGNGTGAAPDSGQGSQPVGQDTGQTPSDRPGDGAAGTGAADGTAPKPRQPITDPGRCGGILDAVPAHDGAAQAETESNWQARVRQAAAVAKRTCGDMPGDVAALVAELSKPRLDAKELLRRFLDDSNSKDYSWIRPSQRHLWGGRILPGFIPERPSHVVAIMDSSGSIQDSEMGFFISELQNALDSGAADKITIGLADTELYTAAEYVPGDVISIPERRPGGTAYDHALAWIAENAPDATAILYLTDLECYRFGQEPAAPLIWIVTGDPRRARDYAAAAPFGDSVILEDCEF